MRAEVDQAAQRKRGRPCMPQIELGREYMLAVGQPPPDAGYADQYLAHLGPRG